MYNDNITVLTSRFEKRYSDEYVQLRETVPL